jgi:serine/threonine-protein kinase Chk2
MLRRLIFWLQASPDEQQDSFKKPRRSERLSQRVDHDQDQDHGDDLLKTPVQHKHHLPSPVTHLTSENTAEFDKETTATPPQDRQSQGARRRADDNYSQGLAFSSPPQDTQAFSQQDVDPNAPLVEGVDELKEGVWGYLLPLDTRFVRAPVVLKKKGACPPPPANVQVAEAVGTRSSGRRGQKALAKEKTPTEGTPASGGYVIGRHPECGKLCQWMDHLIPPERTVLTPSQTSGWMTRKYRTATA